MDSSVRLTPFERALVTKLTAGDHVVLAGLRAQAEVVRVMHRNVSHRGLEAQLEFPNPTQPVTPANFSLFDVGYSIAYGWEHFTGSWGSPSPEEPGTASLDVRDGFLATLHAALVFELWPIEHAADGAIKYQADPTFTEGPDYVDVNFVKLAQRDMIRLSERLAA